jgi:hypothetical protein
VLPVQGDDQGGGWPDSGSRMQVVRPCDGCTTEVLTTSGTCVCGGSEKKKYYGRATCRGQWSREAAWLAQ